MTAGPLRDLLWPLGMAILFAGLFVLNERRERIFGLPYDRYAEPARFRLSQATIGFLAIGSFAIFVETAGRLLGVWS